MDPLIACGQPAPSFSLPDLLGRIHRLEEWRGQVVILNFWSAECPWSERADREILARLPGWEERVQLVPVASNANEPPSLLAQVAAQRGLPRVLCDPRQEVAGLYGAQTTPHLFVVDAAGRLRYQGAFDDVTFRQRRPSRSYLIAAVDALLAGQEPDPAQTAPYGCALVRFPPG